ncbi:MAG: LAGLIDADG family homing endonuclease [Candidatus Odinarchaeota archaeon]
MGEYNSDESSVKKKDREVESNKKEDMDDVGLDNDFEPRDEKNSLDNDIFDNFKPKDEVEDKGAKITADFIPDDENSIKHSSKKELDRLEIKWDKVGDFSSFLPELDENRRIEVDNETIKSVINDLKRSKNLSQKKISEIIGTNIKNILYNYTETMNEVSFKRLEELGGKKLKHKIIEKKRFIHERNESLAEFIGIMLGDGHLNKKIYRLQISFNGFNEKQYLHYVKNKINAMFNIDPKERWERNQKNAIGNEKGMFLYIDNKNFFNELISHGLKPGNKVKNQVGVPDWIKKEKLYMKSCLRGLFDTDGSISVLNKRSSLLIDFTNASLPLVTDFKEMCESLDIRTSPKITQRKWKNKITNKTSITYKTTITSKDQILKFLNEIKPKKWEFNMGQIDKKLKSSGSSLRTFLNND